MKISIFMILFTFSIGAFADSSAYNSAISDGNNFKECGFNDSTNMAIECFEEISRFCAGKSGNRDMSMCWQSYYEWAQKRSDELHKLLSQKEEYQAELQNDWEKYTSSYCSKETHYVGSETNICKTKHILFRVYALEERYCYMGCQ